jgi:uncharacterized protein YqhQ
LPQHFYEVKFVNFDEQEEATKIEKIICLQSALWKKIIVVPIASLMTGCFFLLFLHWYPGMKAAFLYRKCDIKNATHIMIEGICKLSFFVSHIDSES